VRQEAQGDGPGGRPPAGVVPLATAGRRRGAPRPCSCPSAPPGPAARAHSQPFEINRAKTENATGCTTNQEEPDCARPSAAPAARRPAGRSQPPGSAGVQQASSEGQLALLGPAGHGLGRHVQDGETRHHDYPRARRRPAGSPSPARYSARRGPRRSRWVRRLRRLVRRLAWWAIWLLLLYVLLRALGVDLPPLPW
jgi:hypothetical protein